MPLYRRVVRFYFYRLPGDGRDGDIHRPRKSSGNGGLRPRDVIIAYDASPVDDLHRLLSEEQIGVTAELTVIRGTERLTMEIVPITFSVTGDGPCEARSSSLKWILVEPCMLCRQYGQSRAKVAFS